MEKSSLAVGVFKELIKFGIQIGDIDIAMVACRLYRDALAPSTKATCKTGIRHLEIFKQKYPKTPLPTDDFTPQTKISISLVFFAAYLFEIDTIKTHGTIRNYMPHVNQFDIKKGYPKKKLESPYLKLSCVG